jgi:hypothetical protein
VVGFPDIVIVSASPGEFPINATSPVTILVRNNGDRPAGPFAVAASFPPTNFYSAFNFSGLAAGTEQAIQLQIQTGPQTGNFQAVIVADLNNEVNEGTGEANNNTFVFNYRIDRPYISSAVTLSAGASLDLDSNGGADVTFSATGLTTNAPCTGTAFCVGLLSPALSFTTAHYDAIMSSTGVNANAIDNAFLTNGATIGVITDSGRRAVIRVDGVTAGVALAITYRVY